MGFKGRPFMSPARYRLPGIRRELEAKIPPAMKTNGFILYTDHSVPESTKYESYRYFLDLGRELGTHHR